jgi:ubiquinol-cytochrome c reductase cytochrome c1 subunit
MHESKQVQTTMMQSLVAKSRLAAFALAASLFAAAGASAAEGGVELRAAQANISNLASVQRGARLYFNYCSGCHAIKYMSYSRLAEDLQLSPEDVLKNFAFTGAKIGDQVESHMPADNAQEWFGKTPPDLSLEARSKGPDWIYTYLLSFYVDPSSVIGWNNSVFPNASMPNPLWELQGVQVAHRAAAKPGEEAAIEKLEVARKGKQSPAEFDETARDLTTFLTYVGEPAALQRESIGVWVILFLAAFTFLAYLVKHEYWTDVH